MKFPVSVVKIGDRMVLLQGFISEDFRKKLSAIESLSVHSKSYPDINLHHIHLNGKEEDKDYRIPSIYYKEDRFIIFQKELSRISKLMGYE